MSMFIESVKSPGLAHISYIIGHKGEAVVVDPRRDCDVYLDIAAAHGCAITHIFETHRNEDYVIGSQELARRTGAAILHGPSTPFEYGNVAREGETFRVGDLELSVLETPGHTFDSISLVLRDRGSGDTPLGVFTGDVLFVGDVGRTDFFPDRREETAGLLYDSIFGKLLPLGDQTLLYPAHGAGSVCGKGMAPRDFSTLGHERVHNAALQIPSRDAFIQRKLGESHPLPPYFRKMEGYNQRGDAPSLQEIQRPRPVGASEFKRRMSGGMQVLDLRSPEAFAGAFIPGCYAIPLDMIPVYAGYFLQYDAPIGLVAESHEQVEKAVRHLLRIGYDHVVAYLEGGLTAWETAGEPYDAIPAVHAGELVRRIQEGTAFTLLDVRSAEEFEEGHIPGARHIYLGDVPELIETLPRDTPVTTFCGSGQRAIIAASLLKRAGFVDVEDALGSMAACHALGCPIEEGV